VIQPLVRPLQTEKPCHNLPRLKNLDGTTPQRGACDGNNPTYSRRTRHIELRWHFVRDQVQRGLIQLVKVKGEENPADAFTKPLDRIRLEKLCDMMGIKRGVRS
jgi:hypothetical protein